MIYAGNEGPKEKAVEMYYNAGDAAGFEAALRKHREDGWNVRCMTTLGSAWPPGKPSEVRYTMLVIFDEA